MYLDGLVSLDKTTTGWYISDKC